MWSIGIMQGRLTEPKGRGIQFFPFDNWEKEFSIASKIGLQEIEFIFDYDCYEKNPLWLNSGESIKEVSGSTGINVKSVCFDYFMRRAFFKMSATEKQKVYDENFHVLSRVLESMDKIGAALIEIPLVDESSLKNEREADDFRTFLMKVLADAPKNIMFGLETDLPPQRFKEYLDSFGEKRIGANYDSGNSSGIGYLPYEEVTALKDRIFNIHIKDRIYHGTTVELGRGSADFEGLFRGLKEIGYGASFILQAARGAEGEEEETIQKQCKFLRDWIKLL